MIEFGRGVSYSTPEIRDGLVMVRINVGTAPNQDAKTLLIVSHNEDGTQFYLKDMGWQVYSGFDLLDVTGVSLHGRTEVRYDHARQPSGT